MLSILAFVVTVIAIALWRYQTAIQRNHQLAHDAMQDSRNSYPCVEIHAGIAVCEAARRLENTRFLYENAPELPLPGCTAETCTCIYIHHDDRRVHSGRNSVGHRESFPYATVGERRSRNAQHPETNGANLSYPGFH